MPRATAASKCADPKTRAHKLSSSHLLLWGKRGVPVVGLNIGKHVHIISTSTMCTIPAWHLTGAYWDKAHKSYAG